MFLFPKKAEKVTKTLNKGTCNCGNKRPVIDKLFAKLLRDKKLFYIFAKKFCRKERILETRAKLRFTENTKFVGILKKSVRFKKKKNCDIICISLQR